jgi:hypothetical protein
MKVAAAFNRVSTRGNAHTVKRPRRRATHENDFTTEPLRDRDQQFLTAKYGKYANTTFVIFRGQSCCFVTAHCGRSRNIVSKFQRPCSFHIAAPGIRLGLGFRLRSEASAGQAGGTSAARGAAGWLPSSLPRWKHAATGGRYGAAAIRLRLSFDFVAFCEEFVSGGSALQALGINFVGGFPGPSLRSDPG